MLIKTIAELRTYIKVDITNQYASVSPYIRDAENKYMREYIGDTLYDKLDTYHNAEDPDDNAAYDALIPYIQNALAKYTLLLAAPHFDIKVMETGFGVISNQNVSPASKERVQRYMDSLEPQALDNVETLLAFLEDNKDDYTDWTASTAYTMQTINLVNSATEFNKWVDISKSRLKFRHLRQIMFQVDELHIKPVISPAYFEDIIAELQSGTVSAATTAIINDLKRAEVHWAAALDGMDARNEQLADHYIARVKDYMYDNIDDYPVFAASDEYDEDRTDNQMYDNDVDNGFFIFGPNFK